MTTTETKLVKGEKYDVDSLVVSGWTGDSDGLFYADYFDADGRYKGPDAEGVEPLFAGDVRPIDA